MTRPKARAAANRLVATLSDAAAAKWKPASTEARHVAYTLGKSIAVNLDDAWNRAQFAPDGPIDVIDMFSGCGGMSAGFRAINGSVPAYRIAGAVDIDQVANKTYEANFKLSPAHLDVAKVARRRNVLDQLLDARRPKAPLILIGCAPCQGFSSHRNTAGEGDPRNSLFVDFARIAAQIHPDAVVIENVPELLTDRYWPFVTTARSLLEHSGYFVHLGVHNMAAFGVPQERFRALMVAMRRPFAPPKGFLDRGNFRTVRAAIGSLPPVEPGVRNDEDKMHHSAGHNESTIETIRQVPKDGGSRPSHVGPDCLRRAAKRNGRAVYEDVYGRLFWDRPSITITAYARNPASGRFVHPEQDRGLTIREAALLQGFPSKYWFIGSLDDCFRQIGNAVPPAFAAFVATHMLGELLSESPHCPTFEAGIAQPIGPSFSRLIPSLKAGHRTAA